MIKWRLSLYACLVLGTLLASPTGVCAKEIPHLMGADTDELLYDVSKPQSSRLSARVEQLPHQVRLVIDGTFQTGELVTAVWSDQNGQDDVVWQTYQPFETYAEALVQTTEKGTYYLQTFQKDADVMRLVHTTRIESSGLPQCQIEQSDMGHYHMDITNVSDDIVNIYLPTWSDVNGQDDVVWHRAEPLEKGHYHLSLPLGQYHDDEGQYQVHVYGETKDGQLIGLFATDGFRVEQKPLNPQQPVTLSPNTYPIGQCTWGVKEQATWVGNDWGNARDWGESAQARGFIVGKEARVGAVVVWPHEGLIDGMIYGHVAYVTDVRSNQEIRVTESNYGGQLSLADYRGWFDPNHAFWGGDVYYIYPHD